MIAALSKLFADAQVECFQSDCSTGLPTVEANEGALQTGLQIGFGIIGALAVIVILLAMIKLSSAAGNPQEAAVARKALVFAIIGLVVALSAEMIVTFVLRGVLG